MEINVSVGDRVAALERALAEKERENAALRVELLRMRAMVEHAPVGVFQDDGASQCLYVNAAWSTITGMPRADALGTGWMRVIHPEEIPRLAEAFAKASETGAPFSADYRVIRPDGQVRWVQGQSRPLIGPDGEALGFVGTIQDITERVEAKAAIEETREALEKSVIQQTEQLRTANEGLRVYEALFEHATDALVLATPEGDVTHVNPAYEALFGKGEEVVGASLVDALRPYDMTTRETVYAALVDGATARCSAMLRGRDDEAMPAQVDCYIVRDAPEHVLGLAAVIRDLSEEKREEEERAALEAKVIAAQEELIRELSTPLMPIARGVIAMPLVGSISEARAEHILEALLAGIGEHGARTAILDITGVPMVDTHAANALISAARAARLLGTAVILSGIGPAVARTLVELGIELGEMTTTSTLAAAIAKAVGGTRRK